MIDKRDALTIFHDSNSTFSDYSHKMVVFGRDGVTLNISSSLDYIYIGFHKPINSFYVNISTVDGAEGSLNLEYYNGSNWNEVSNKSDDTLGFYRSGFVRWDRELQNNAKTSVDDSTKYWYRLKLDQDRTGMVIEGLNIVFSDDYELSLEQPYISDQEFLGSESSHIKTHSAVKREIIQRFRNKNYIKYNHSTGEKEDINAWDLLDIDEVRLAATYLALSKIYYQLSDNPDDVWASKSAMYENKFNKYVDLATLSVDVDDDGLISPSENKPAFTNRYMRR